MRVTFEPFVGRIASRNRVIRWVGGAGANGFINGAMPSFCCRNEAVSSIGSGSFSASIVTYFPWKFLLDFSEYPSPESKTHHEYILFLPAMIINVLTSLL
jgi:hypothetical protein